MPRTPKTLLDELAKTLRVRQNANLRFNRRVANTDMPNRYVREANDLYDRLGESAKRRYFEISGGRFDGDTKNEAWRLMPTGLMWEHNDYVDFLKRRGEEILNDGTLNASEYDYVADALAFRNLVGLEKFLRRKGRI